MKQNKIEKAIHECYCRLYLEAEPPADFNKLIDNAETNERGQKVINFMDYSIDNDRLLEIIEDIIKEYKIKHKWNKQAFRNTIMLGCSPKSK